MNANFDVAVAGSGVAGLAAALGCAQQGLSVALVAPVSPGASRTIDKSAIDDRIYALAPASVELLTRLKVWPRLNADRLQAIVRMCVFGDRGDPLNFDAYTAAVERLATIVEENELARALQDACAYAPGLERIDSAVDTMGVTPQAAVVRLADRRELSCRLVIAADGADSAVRAAAGISADEHRYGQTAVVANFVCERAHQGTAFQWFTDEGVVALLPLPLVEGDPAVSLVWSARDALGKELLAMDPQSFAVRVAARSAHTLGKLAPLNAARGFPLRRLSVAAMVAPRVALIGDAAHVVHPLAGQGLNLGLQDVSKLLAVLAARETKRDCGDLVLLRRYARARAEPVSLMRFTTDGLARLFGIDDPLARNLRNTGLALVNRVGPLKRALIRQALG